MTHSASFPDPALRKARRTRATEGVKKSRPDRRRWVERLCRLLCGKPPAFREAAGPEELTVFLLLAAGPERLSLSPETRSGRGAQQAAKPRFFHTFTGAELQTMNLRGGSARSAEAGTRFGARVRSIGLCFLMLALAALWPQGASAEGETPVRTEVASPSRVAALYAHLPLSFEINQGQTDPSVKYLAHGPGYTLWLTADQAVFALRSSAQPSTTPLPVVRLKLVGSDAAPRVWGEQPLPGRINYFLGNNPQAWHTEIPTFAQVRYGSVYRGVDLVYYGRQGELEYDFELAAGADPRHIHLGVEGGERLELTPGGDLLLHVAGGEVRLQRPVAYQRVGLERRSVAVRYVLGPAGPDLGVKDSRSPDVRARRLRSQEVGFAVGSYDRLQPLVIDPVLSYATYLGGTGGDVAYAIAVDSSGNAYVTGQTFSTDFPTAPTTPAPFQSANKGNGDVFVTKLNSSGSSSGSGLAYSTYLGGTGADAGYGIAVLNGDAFITGTTSSLDFPVAPTVAPTAFQTTYGGDGDAFITQLNSTGDKLTYSSYLGGRGPEVGQAVAVDSMGNAYVTGYTQSSDFPTVGPFQPTTGGGQDAFVAKVNFGGTELLYSTYLGGSNADTGQAIRVDNSEMPNAYVAGFTFSTDFPTKNATQSSNNGPPDAFVAVLDSAGSALVFSTYLGGSSDDRAFGIALDSSGGIYVTGQSLSADFPTTSGSLQTVNHGAPPGSTAGDAFATKFNPSGAGLSYSTFIGGSGADQGNGIAVDSLGEAFITGFTQSSPGPPAGFPILDAVQSDIDLGLGGSCKGNLCSDAFVTKLNASGNGLVYSTYLGGSGADSGQGIALDSTGDPYVAGDTQSTDFPAIAGAYQGVLKGTAGNAFVAKIDKADSPNIAVAPAALNFGNQALSVPSTTQTMTVVNAGTAPLTITEITSSETQYTETSDCVATLNAGGGTCKINVTFTPTATGALGATLSITDNAASSPQSFNLSGTGVTAGTAVTLTPTSLSFSNQAVGTTSSPQTVTITNTGTAVLTITSITISGDFLQTNTCAAAPLNNLLNPMQSCTASVTFAPTASGARSGALSISDNATGSPQTVALSGASTAQFSLTSSSPMTTTLVGSTSVNIPISASGTNFTGSITLSCSASGQTCTFNPASILVGQTSTVTVTGLSASTPSPFNFTVIGTSGSQAATLSLTILFEDYSLSATPLLNTITAGSPATYTIIVTPLNGFNGQVNLSCTGQPPGSTCAFSSTSVTPNGTSPKSVSVTINTTLTSSWPRGSGRGPTGKWPLLPITGLIIGIMGLAALWRFLPLGERTPALAASGLRRWLSLPRLAAAGLMLALLLLAGCRSANLSPTGTPTGNYSITINGTLNSNTAVVRTTIITLAVECPPNATCP